jgi:putative DNA primase/helicase
VVSLADAVRLYTEAGWEVVPLPPGLKAPMPAGLTGYAGRPASLKKLLSWLENGFRANDPETGKLRTFDVAAIGLRLPETVIGLDVDSYDGKPGAAGLAEMEAAWGPLPPGPLSTARREAGDMDSGIRLLRVPAGRKWKSEPKPGIETVTWYHRTVVCWPSVHHTGASYYWYDSRGHRRKQPPSIGLLPEMNAKWAAGLSRPDNGPAYSGMASRNEITEFFASCTGNDYPGAWRGMVKALRNRAGEGGSRHGGARRSARRAMEEARAGAYPAAEAAKAIRDVFLELAGTGRAAEWDRVIAYAVSCALAKTKAETEEIAAELLATKGNRDKITGSPANPMRVARDFLDLSQAREVSTVTRWRGAFYRWDGSQWNETEMDVLRGDIYHWLEDCKYAKARATKTQPKLKPSVEAWLPNVVTVNRVLDALAAVALLPSEAEPGTWADLTGSRFTIPGKPYFKEESGRVVLDGSSTSLLSVPTPVIALSTALLEVKTRVLHPPHPSFFNLSSIEFSHLRTIEGGSSTTGTTLDFDCPEWKLFLKSVWPDDEESIRLLRQWFGYVLSGDASRQKIMLMVGPKRSGKGTIGRVLRSLMTARNVASPTTESLKDRFGLSSLIGKPLAIISDARFEGWGVQTAVERLLAISGQDAIDVDRKNKPIWNGQLGTRFMIMSNKVPALLDSSGAIASRFLVLQLTSSWFGREDRELEARLMAELPGILFWALDGMFELEGAAQFAAPESAAEAHESMEGLSSPHSTFVSEMCNCDETESVPCSELYQAWCRWCERNGRRDAGNSAVFGRDLRAAIPGISRRNPRIPGSRVWVYQGLCMKEDTDDEGALPTVRDMKRKL